MDGTGDEDVPSPDATERVGPDAVEVVIPSVKKDILTLDSVPDGVSTHVERKGTLNEARNRGVSKVGAEVAIIMDDDIAFPEETFWELVDRAGPEKLVGMSDWNYGWVAGRVMVFHVDTWRELGGFDERLRSHMGDTEFSLKFLTDGHEIETVPQDWFDHREHDRSIDKWDHAWRGVYLAAKYPRYGPKLLTGMIERAI